MCVRIVVTFVILTTAYDWYFPTLAVVILAILNDGCMISISRDRVTPNENPDKWNPWVVFSSAIGYGAYLAVSTIVLFEVVTNTNYFQDRFGLAYLADNELVGLIYLQVSISGLSTIFITRSRTLSFLDRPGVSISVAFLIAQIVASVIAAYGLDNYNGFGGAGWGYVAVAWTWACIWYLPLDLIKFAGFSLVNTKWWQHNIKIKRPIPSLVKEQEKTPAQENKP